MTKTTGDTALSEPLLRSLDSGVLTLTLHRPAARNALSLEMLDALAAALDEAAEDDSVRVVLLTGAGRGFCAGGDVETLARGESIFGPMSDRPARVARQIEVQRATAVRLWEYPKPTVAALNGHAVGAGMALALACDLRYAVESAELRPGFSAVGLAGDFGATWLLSTLIGRARAVEALLYAEPITARRAVELGVVNAVFGADEFSARVADRVRALAKRSAPAVAAIKRNVVVAGHSDLATAADAEVYRHVELLETPEHRAALEQIRSRGA
ncbi:enoyl-CoA hydratase-related protein [Nocardia bovistercoris]|uniref:Enoyl-CoA hydratase/isomerase family protein n=1 Tax=Nocardia bovistercoris TaxID=2785916 RepID=A0A931IFT1_9NOCA|nr:enoyl-CoA hydratase-related protein [Nocardia bovistercoris]MBH0779758.1 enoyl-CoA hydratase/isomerase family protein [Nocardia bovistercoris]